MRKTKIQKLEDQLKAYHFILKRPVTINPPDLKRAMDYYENLQYIYELKTGQRYVTR